MNTEAKTLLVALGDFLIQEIVDMSTFDVDLSIISYNKKSPSRSGGSGIGTAGGSGSGGGRRILMSVCRQPSSRGSRARGRRDWSLL